MSQLKKVVEKIGGIVLSGALMLNALGSVPVQKVRAEDDIEVVDISKMDGLKEEIGNFLNKNALNSWNGNEYIEDYEVAAGKKASVYFLGNEYCIVNAAGGKNKIGEQKVATLVATKSYRNMKFKDGARYYMVDVKYKGSDIEKYLTGNKAADFMNAFGGNRKLELNSVVKKKILTGEPGKNDNNFVKTENYPSTDSTTEAANDSHGVYVSEPKFYLPGGSYAFDSTYAYAGQNELAEDGFKVHNKVFDSGIVPWLRSA